VGTIAWTAERAGPNNAKHILSGIILMKNNFCIGFARLLKSARLDEVSLLVAT
jgi:hypothetical protein